TNSAAWTGGSPTTEVTNFGDSVKVGLYTLTTATLPVSNDARWIARVHLMAASGAAETASNPLTLSQGIVVTVDENAVFTDNAANLVNGNFNIQGKFGLRVSTDAAAPLGGSDTVKVYLRSTETIVGVEATLSFAKTNFTANQSSVVFGSALFAGGASLTVIATDSTLKVVGFPVNIEDSIAASSTERMLFSVILGVKDSAAAGVSAIGVGGIVTTRDVNYSTDDVTVTSLTNGSFLVRAPYEIQVQSRNAGPAADGVEVNVLITNQSAVATSEIKLKYDKTRLTYVTGSVTANTAIWQNGSAPTPDVIAAGDSVKVGFYDLTGAKYIMAGNSAAVLFSLKFDLSDSLTVGSSTTITPSGIVAIETDGALVEQVTSFIAGTITVTLDVLPPGEVETATATAGTSSVMLGWTNPGDADLDYIEIVRRTSSDTVTVVMDNDPVASASGTYEDTGVASGPQYYYDFISADLNGNLSTVTVGPVSIGPAPAINQISVRTSKALSGGVAVSRVYLTNNTPVAGVSLKFTFDRTVLQITDVMPGRDVAGLAPVGEINVDSANASGSFKLDAIDATLSDPIEASSTVKEVLVVQYMVDESAESGDSFAVMLDSVSASDPEAVDIPLTVVNGYVVIVGTVENDVNGDGEINVVDLWNILHDPNMVPFEALAQLIAYLLSQPMPTTLAAAQDAVYTAAAANGAALIGLKTDYEIVAARFTFSYDNAYEVTEVVPSQALRGKIFIKKMLVGDKLVVDVISLVGFVPDQLGGEMFSVAFRDADHRTAGLTLEKVELADRNGNVRTETFKAAQVALPKAYALSQNSPNPFNPSTTIAYAVPDGAGAVRVALAVYNLRGQKVVTLVDELKEAGEYKVTWDGINQGGQKVSSGVYFYRMTAGDYSAVRKMVILK
ncbi:MAG: cohesin domain-containing protein, partial [Candidatus Glassbacteria bacterium]